MAFTLTFLPDSILGPPFCSPLSRCPNREAEAETERERNSIFISSDTDFEPANGRESHSFSQLRSLFPSVSFPRFSSLFLFSSDERVAKRAKKEYYSTLRSHIDFFPFRSLCVYLAVLRQPVSYTRHHAVRTPLPFPDENPTESGDRDAGKWPDRSLHALPPTSWQPRVMTVSSS